MRISNSKKQLAKIISENGGWREGAESAAQCNRGEISFWHNTAKKRIGEDWCGSYLGCEHDIEFTGGKIPNWHQTILSRDEYSHLYPAQGAVVVENKTTCHLTLTDKPTIEQLAAEYRNRKDYAERKQQEADDAMAEADVKLAELVAAGKAVGLAVSVAAPEPELVITDWRDLREGDVIRCVGDAWDDAFEGSEAVVSGIESHDYKYEHRICACIGEESDWGADFHFIRRPAKETNHA